MSNNKLKKDLSNAKARLKAASKKLEKIESSGNIQLIASAQNKVDLEKEIIDDIERRILSETDNVIEIVREEDGSITNIVESDDANDVKSLKEVINLVPLKTSKKSTRDLPQVSFRTEEILYQKLKHHIKNPESIHLSTFDSLADMSRRLNLSDLNGNIHFILKRTNQQLSRFLDIAKLDELQPDQKKMLRNAFINFHADCDADKAKLIEQLESLHQFIESLDLYGFEK